MNRILLAFNVILLLILSILVWHYYIRQNGLISQKNKTINEVVEYDIMLPNLTQFKVGLNQDGSIKYVSNFIDSLEQMIFYHENGVVKSKIYFDLDGLEQKRAYFFFQNSGSLSGDFKYNDGLINGSAITYHDSSNHIKEILYYNSAGELYYKKIFDWEGNLIREEGNKF